MADQGDRESSSEGRRIVAFARSVADGVDDAAKTPSAEDENPILRALREISSVHDVHRGSTAVSEPSGWAPAARWQHFDILEKLGEGGYGTVFLAQDTKLGRRVALKLLRENHSPDVGANQGLVREAEHLATLHSPNIATVYGVDEVEGRVGIWMEYIKGKTLKRLLREQGPMGEREAAIVGIDVCRALAAVHERGLLHRDVKAENVIREEGGRYVLTDFGVGMRIDDSLFAAPAGTPLYLAPEVLAGKPASVRTDVYAVGVLLYHLVTADFPLTAPDLTELRSAHAAGRARLLRDVRPGLSPAFHHVVDRALAPMPEKRFSTPGEMELALMSALGSSPLENPVEVGARETDSATAEVGWSKIRWSLVLLACVLSISASTFLLTRRGSELGAPPTPETVAVMSFENLSGDGGFDWLSTGLTELVATDLAQSRGISVIPVSSVVAVQGRYETEPDAGAPGDVERRVASELGATALLAGAFTFEGETLQISARLWSTGGEILTSKAVRGRLSEELFSMVDELTVPLRQALEPQPAPQELLDRELADVTTASAEAYRYYAEALALQYRGKFVECVPLYQRAIEIDPNFALALTKLSILSGIEGRIDDALAYSARAVEQLDSVTLRERYYIEGNHDSWRESTYGRAIASFERAVEQYPDHWAARHNLGIMYWELERYRQAVERFEETRRHRPELTALYRPLALSYTGLGDFASTLQVLQDWIARSEGSYGAYRELGHIYTLWGDPVKAAEAYAMAEEAAPRVFDMGEHLWRIHVIEEDWEALDAWIAGRQLPAGRGEDRLRLALALLYRGRTREALETLERDDAGEPGWSRTAAASHLLAGHVALIRGEYSRALSHAEQAQRTGDGDHGEWGGLYLESLASAHLGKWQTAHELAERLHGRSESLPTLREQTRHQLLLASLSLLANDAETALEHARKAASLLPPEGIFWAPRQAPLHVPVWLLTAEAHFAMGDLPEARATLERLLASDGERLLWPLETARALVLLRRAHELEGEESKASEIAERLREQWSAADVVLRVDP